MYHHKLRQESTVELDDSRDFELMGDIALVEMEDEKLSDLLVVPVKDEATKGRVAKVGRNPQLRKRVSDFNIGVDLGVPIEHEIQPGNRVLISRAQGMYVKWNGKPAMLIHEDEILAVLE